MERDSNHIAQKLIECGNFILERDYEPIKAAGDPENPEDFKDPDFNSEQIKKANDLINNLELEISIHPITRLSANLLQAVLSFLAYYKFFVDFSCISCSTHHSQLQGTNTRSPYNPH